MLALITGATSGFGESTARLLLQKGHAVIGTGRRQERLEAFKNLLPSAEMQARFLPLAFDIQDAEATNKAWQNLQTKDNSRWANIDLLVNNAGLALGLEPAHQALWDDWQNMIDTNITGLVRITRLVLPGMVQRNHGHIINVGSVAANYPYPGGNVYGASKAFVKQFSRNLRADVNHTAGSKVRISCIEPGLCGGTEFSQVRFHGDNDKAAKIYDGVDYLTPDDVANAIVWMAELPAHVNINFLELMPVAQSFGPLSVKREVK